MPASRGLCAGHPAPQARRHRRLRHPREGATASAAPGATTRIPAPRATSRRTSTRSRSSRTRRGRARTAGRRRSSPTSSTAPTKYGLRPHLRFGARSSRARATTTPGRVDGDDRERRALRRARAAPRQRRAAPAGDPRPPGARDASRARRSTRRAGTTATISRGKRVAVIGTGASAIQFVPQIAPQVDAARTCSSARRRGSCRSRDRAIDDARAVGVRARARRALAAPHRPVLAAREPRARLRVRAEGESRSPRSWSCANTRAAGRGSGAAREAHADYRIGCKRVLISNDYYPALQPRQRRARHRRRSPRSSRRGIRTRDGREREVDAIIFGTGFKRRRLPVVDPDRRRAAASSSTTRGARRCATTSASPSRGSRTCSC